jgi:tRNA(adenine34) deaminase
MEVFTDEYFMQRAIAEAQKAMEEDEIPIGAVVVYENDVTAHAEMLAITAAASYLNSKFLDECTLYVTIEPCLMCAGAIKWARFHKIVFGAEEPKTGFTRISKDLLGKKTQISGGVMAEECAALMQHFFKQKRN